MDQAAQRAAPGHLRLRTTLLPAVIALVTLPILQIACGLGPPAATPDAKVHGLVFTGPPQPPIARSTFAAMTQVGATHVALVPEATLYRQTLRIQQDHPHQWYGETTAAVVEGIRRAREAGLAVMLKPHLEPGWDLSGWNAPDYDPRNDASREAYLRAKSEYLATQPNLTAGTGSWRGELDVGSDQDWPRLADAYRDFVLEHAHLAERHGVEIFCIGTELKRLALRRPDFWRELAEDVRRVYSGPLVYSANWDSAERIEFWDAMDYIGVNAYFPLSDQRTPEPSDITAAWEGPKGRLADLHGRFRKPILFTEWGYENEDYAAKEPWIMGPPAGASGTNEEAQANAYEGTFAAVWDEPWLAGIFVWRWAPEAIEVGNYSPRGRRAATVLGRWWRGEPGPELGR